MQMHNGSVVWQQLHFEDDFKTTLLVFLTIAHWNSSSGFLVSLTHLLEMAVEKKVSAELPVQ